ncbi:MAG: hypothetical protein Q8O56_12065 [Solirubrobacteraceae bacterium]|nr:hypothetical protein [Solirubrobacteraceae bacterium]
MSIKSFIGIASVALVAALAGCGGDSSSDGASSGAGDDANVEQLLEDTFGANPKASSGRLRGRIDINVEGVPTYRKPIALTMTGPFGESANGTPEANLTVAIELRDTALGGELILKGDKALIGLGSTGYEIPDSISTPLRKPLVGSDNTLGAIMAVFGVAPRRWAKSPRIVGNEELDGVDTIHGTAQIDAQRFFLDVAKLTKTLTALRVTDITGLPKVIDRQHREALVRSVTSATGAVYTGADDKVMRKAEIDIELKPSAADSKRLGGITSLTIDGELNVTEVGATPRVELPVSSGSYAELQVALDVLADNARQQFR